QTDLLWEDFKRRLAHSSHFTTLAQIEREFRQEVQDLYDPHIDPLRVRLVGEIWVLMEPYANLDMEKLLGNRDDVRVWVHREVGPGAWVEYNLLRHPRALRRQKYLTRLAAPYLREHVGGHGLETIGLTVAAPQEGMDGVIHLFPFTCMPEIVAQNILVQVSNQLDLPVLTYIASEQTGEAGLETRLEAFLDLLLERRYTRKTEVVG
ncbi:MAG: hypothetical protein ACOYD6_07965, partial [Limnochordia bacterium]